MHLGHEERVDDINPNIALSTLYLVYSQYSEEKHCTLNSENFQATENSSF